MSSYTNVFGGNNIYPSDVSYLALSLTADITLQWPIDASTSDTVVARIIDVTPTAAYSITMPDATQTAPGQIVLWNNLGPDTVTVKSSTGTTLLSIASGQQWELYLIDNTTAGGLWRTFQFGAATASAQASALAGYGLVATGSTLSQSTPITSFNTDYTWGAADRAAMFLWTGGVGTLTLPTAGSVGNSWFSSVRNGGAGNLTISAQGSDKLNDISSISLSPGDSTTVVCDGTNFFTLGLGQNAVFAFDYTSIDLTGQSTPYTLGTTEQNRIAYSFVGVLTANTKINVPATIQQYWVANNTTGGSYTLSIGVSGQTPFVTVARGGRGIYYCDGSIVVNADTASISTPIAVVDGGTGSTTAGGALINLGGTAPGIGVFTAATAALARTAIGSAASGANSDITSLTGLSTPLAATEGGTGISGYAVGDILYASTTTALSKLAGVATGNVLLSGGVTTAPSWGKVNLATAVSGLLPAANGGTGISSLGAGVATFLGTPSSANLAAALTDKTGTGVTVFSTSPTLVSPALGTPSTVVLTNGTGLPLTTGVSGLLPIANGGTSASTAAGARTALGSTTVGDALFITASAAAARATLGSGSTGDALFLASTAAGARSTLGLGTAAVLDVGTSANNIVQLDGSAKLPAVDGSQLLNLPSSNAGAPVTKTADFTVGSSENVIICNKPLGVMTATLPSPATLPGREIMLKNVSTTTAVNSASSNVVQFSGGGPSNVIVGNGPFWANMVSDGTNWVIMAQGSGV